MKDICPAHQCFHDCFFFLVCGIECPTCSRRFPIEQIEDHADACASHLIEFEDGTGADGATTSNECRLERAFEIWVDDKETK